MFSVLFILALPLLTISGVPGARAAGGFAATCSGFFVRDNHYLQAHCGDGRGGYKDSTIDLNLCIANYNSHLVCAHKCVRRQTPGKWIMLIVDWGVVAATAARARRAVSAPGHI